jgi:hypothetical protein
VLLAPTHRARWDALLLPLAAGVRVTGRHCRFMVTLDEFNTAINTTLAGYWEKKRQKSFISRSPDLLTAFLFPALKTVFTPSSFVMNSTGMPMLISLPGCHRG